MGYDIVRSNTEVTEIGIEYDAYKESKEGLYLLFELMKSEDGSIEIDKINPDVFYFCKGETKLKFTWKKDDYTCVQVINAPLKLDLRRMIQDYFDSLNTQMIQEAIDQINTSIGKAAWFDFMVSEYRGSNLHIVGSTDLSYYYELEVIFEEVFFMCCNTFWHTAPSELKVFTLIEGEEAYSINYDYQIEAGNYLIRIQPEDEKKPFYIACRNVRYSYELKKYG